VSRRRWKQVMAAVGGAVSLALIATVFVDVHPFAQGGWWSWRVDPAVFVRDIPAQLPWFLPFLLLCALQLPLRAVQWQATLRAEVPLASRYHLVSIGALVHNALPGKLGDVTRAWLLAREERLPLVESLGSVGVCKLLEFVALVGVAALASLSPAVPEAMRGGLRMAALACLGLCAGVFALAQLSARLARRCEGRGWRRAAKFFTDADAGLHTVRRPLALLKAVGLSALPVLAPALGYGLALQVMGIPGGWLGGPLVLLAIAVGQSVLIVPAGVGLYFVATGWAAQALGATTEQAALLATLTHVALLASQCGLGALSLWARKLSLTGLDEARRASSSSKGTPELVPVPVAELSSRG
jgi:hypothetical protein